MSARPGHRMDRTNPGGLTATELADQRQRRLDSGCCPDCGRPASVILEPGPNVVSALLRCGCGWELEVKRGSSAFAQAKVWVKMRGAR